MFSCLWKSNAALALVFEILLDQFKYIKLAFPQSIEVIPFVSVYFKISRFNNICKNIFKIAVDSSCFSVLTVWPLGLEQFCQPLLLTPCSINRQSRTNVSFIIQIRKPIQIASFYSYLLAAMCVELAQQNRDHVQ